jgi:hypothetical protein
MLGKSRASDERRRHVHLMKRLAPDLFQPVGRAHAGADAGIDEFALS